MVYIASDHGGYDLKNEIIKYFKKENIEYEDLGTNSKERTDYPIFAKKVCEKIIENGNSNSKGILICKSGHGMTYTANKFKGIRCSLAYSKESIIHGVEDDDINVIALSSNDLDNESAIDIVEGFLSSKFKNNERYLERVKMVLNIEKENFK